MEPYEMFYHLLRRGPDLPGQIFRIKDAFDKGANVGQAISAAEIAVNLSSLLLSSDKITGRWGIEGRSPYLAKDLFEFMYNLPVEQKFTYPNFGKKLLREAAMEFGVPKEIALDTDKKGFSTPTNIWLSLQTKKTKFFFIREMTNQRLYIPATGQFPVE